MKYSTRFNKIMKLEDSNLKLLKLISLGLDTWQGTKIHEQVTDEIHRLFNLGYKGNNWISRNTPLGVSSNDSNITTDETS